MAALKAGDRVEHVTDASLGDGIVKLVDEVAGVRTAYVVWNGTTGLVRHTEEQLRVVEPLPEQLGRAGPGATVPFQLRVLGRWFQARHEQTGEITNQPFDMLPHRSSSRAECSRARPPPTAAAIGSSPMTSASVRPSRPA